MARAARRGPSGRDVRRATRLLAALTGLALLVAAGLRPVPAGAHARHGATVSAHVSAAHTHAPRGDLPAVAVHPTTALPAVVAAGTNRSVGTPSVGPSTPTRTRGPPLAP